MLALSLALLIFFLYLWLLSGDFWHTLLTTFHIFIFIVIVGLIIWGGMSIS